jgi:hypothetical protein
MGLEAFNSNEPKFNPECCEKVTVNAIRKRISLFSVE